MVAAGCYKPTVNEPETITAAQAFRAVRYQGGGDPGGPEPIERS
jgi:hypothetical protein